MKNRKKLAKGVVALSMALSLGTAILTPTHKVAADGNTMPGGWAYANRPSQPPTGCSCPWIPECTCTINGSPRN